MNSLVNYEDDLMEFVEASTNDDETNEEESIQFVRSVTAFMNKTHKTVAVSGSKRMERILQFCTSMPGYTLSLFQRDCLRDILRIIAPIVFKGCSAQDLAVYMRKTKQRVISQLMMFLQTSRRTGKTDIITMACAGCMVEIPNLEQIAWSLYNETSELFGETVVKWLLDQGYASKKSKCRVRVFTADPSDVRVLRLLGSQNPHVSLIFLSIYFFFSFSLFFSIFSISCHCGAVIGFGNSRSNR